MNAHHAFWGQYEFECWHIHGSIFAFRMIIIDATGVKAGCVARCRKRIVLEPSLSKY